LLLAAERPGYGFDFGTALSEPGCACRVKVLRHSGGLEGREKLSASLQESRLHLAGLAGYLTAPDVIYLAARSALLRKKAARSRAYRDAYPV